MYNLINEYGPMIFIGVVVLGIIWYVVKGDGGHNNNGGNSSKSGSNTNHNNSNTNNQTPSHTDEN